MANIFEKDDEQKSGGVTGSQAPTLTQQQAVTTQGAGPQKGPASSGRFTGVQKFLKANRPGQFAEQAAGKVTGRAEQVKGQVGQAQQQFNLALDPTRQNVATGQQGVQSFTASDTSGGTPGLTSALEGIQGPQVTGLSGAERMQSQARTVTNLGKSLASGQGRQTALQQLYGRPSYTAGQQKFDNLLLGADPKALMQARAKTAALQGMVGKSAQVAEQEAAGLGQAAQDVTGQARSEYDKRVQAYMDRASDRAGKLTAERQNELDVTLKDLRSGQLSEGQIAALGLDPATANYLSNEDLATLLKAENVNISRNEAINANEAEYLRGLQNVAGKYASGATQTLGSALSDKELGQLGKAFSFNNDAYREMNAKAAADYESGEQGINTAQKQFSDMRESFGFNDPDTLKNAENLAQMAARGEDISSYKRLVGYRNEDRVGEGVAKVPVYKSGEDIVNEYNTMQNAQRQADAAKQGFDSRWGSVRRSLRR